MAWPLPNLELNRRHANNPGIPHALSFPPSLQPFASHSQSAISFPPGAAMTGATFPGPPQFNAADAAPAVETLPEVEVKTEEKVKEAFEKNWHVIVWNDPVNLMSYVVFVFMKVLAFTKEKATKHMLEVHHQGKSVVATETREKAELYHQQIQAHGLSVTIESNS